MDSPTELIFTDNHVHCLLCEAAKSADTRSLGLLADKQ